MATWKTFLQDLYNDTKWSSDIKDVMSEICDFMNIKFTAPENYVPHRWLSVYDCALGTMRLFEVLMVMYYGFLPANMKPIYREVLNSIVKNAKCNREGKACIQELQAELQKKKLTDAGKKRKERIFEKLIYKHKETSLLLTIQLQKEKHNIITDQILRGIA